MGEHLHHIRVSLTDAELFMLDSMFEQQYYHLREPSDIEEQEMRVYEGLEAKFPKSTMTYSEYLKALGVD